MGNSKKNYDTYISSGKRYLYKTRTILFLLAIITFILNLSIIAVFDVSMRKNAIIFILSSSLFAVVQLVDNRKVHWSWPYIIVLSTLFLGFSAFAVFVTELIFMRYIWMSELIFACGFLFLLLRKEK